MLARTVPVNIPRSTAKKGRFLELGEWIHHFNGVTGVHLVVLYICCGETRLPWSFLIWHGQHQPSPAELALKMLTRLPRAFRQGRSYYGSGPPGKGTPKDASPRPVEVPTGFVGLTRRQMVERTFA